MHKVAIIQFSPELDRLDYNHARAVKFIRDAAATGAELAVLPEYHLADFFPSHDPAVRQKCANWRKYLNSYCALAKELSICIVPGTIAELHVDGSSKTERLVNVAYFIDHTGTICGRYEKQNLWIPEREFVDKGRGGHVAFDTPLGKAGLLVCWDLAFPEAFRNLIQQGAKLIIIPAFWKLSDATEAGLMRNPNQLGLKDQGLGRFGVPRGKAAD